MTQHEIPTHYGPEELGPKFRQPTSEELRIIEEGKRRPIGFQALHTLGDWGPAHHRNDESPIVDGID